MSDQRQVKHSAEERLNAIFANATEADRQIAYRLLRQRRTTFGISLMCLSAFVVAVAALFHPSQPSNTLMVLLMALVLVIVGAAHIDHRNRARRRLAEKLLMRMRRRAPDRDRS